MTPYVHPQRMRARWMAVIWMCICMIGLVFQMLDQLPGWALITPIVSTQVWLAAEWVLVTVRDWEDR